MNGPSPIARASERQAEASRPDASVWVSANAGSGKTHVLVNRIIRLLLSGTGPERILCLTFTRAAAAEMESRLFGFLSRWICESDDDLRPAISKIMQRPATADDLSTARRLFTRALETPGGLKIQTLHGFCESVLQRFPVEAGLAPGFRILDERSSAELMQEARDLVLQRASQDVDSSEEGRSLRHIIAQVRAPGFDEVLLSLLQERSERILNWRRPDVAGALRTALFGEFGLDPDDDPQDIVRDALAGMDRKAAGNAAEVLGASGSKTDRSRARGLEAALERGDWDAHCDVFLTREGGPRKSLATKAIGDESPEVPDWLVSEQERVVEVQDRIKGAETARASDALFTIAGAILRRFRKMKERRGQLDYDDLVHCTRELLSRLDSDWVLYRLDGGIDHVLIDEAQDTSREQWEIVRRLTDEFFAGRGADRETRTVFAVGDHKQSIFSFQGAEPDRFMEEKAALEKRVSAAKEDFRDVRINISFRSTQRVLDVVDRVFANCLAQRGMADPEIDHVANRGGQAGLVELWPLFEQEDMEDRDPYDPVDAPARSDPRLRLAEHVASTIRGWLDAGEELTPRGRPVRPGDVLILVRNRTVLAEALVRKLREANIPVAGADRLTVNSHIAAMDLAAFARVMHMPRDDHSLACVLKSPLVEKGGGGSLDDEDLIALCAKRQGSLWRALGEFEEYGELSERLHRFRRDARYMRPFEFFSEVLEVDGARQRFAGRFGPEVHDVLDEFLALALDYERTHPPVLQGFVEWFTDGDTQIKRDMDQGRDEVRVMTVHGAKGLEANIVILPDTTRLPDRKTIPSILTFPSGIPVWKLASRRQPSNVVDLGDEFLERRMEEENRLLYVAMTRARDRLYVAGTQPGRSAPKPECWYELVRGALEDVAEDAGDGILRWSAGQDAKPSDGEENAVPAIVPETPEPWMLRAAPEEPPASKPLAPSRLDVETGDSGPVVRMTGQPAASPLAGAHDNRFQRGLLIHRLLQTLPDLDADRRRGAARRFLEIHGGMLETEARSEVVEEVMTLLDASDPDLRSLFAEGGMAEVPLVGRVDLTHENGAPVVVSGSVDRLVVSDDEILVADFKTNRPPPEDPSEVAVGYVRQLAAYREVLRAIYPGRPVRTWLVWTFNAHAMEIPSEMLDGAFT